MKKNKENVILVSICVLTYNHEAFIKEALDSFLMQKVNFNFEIVIHDDASTDKTQSILKEYDRNYPGIFNLLLQTENQRSKLGGGMNPRFNYPRAKGKYIALCEGDDYWTDPLKLQKQVDFLEKNEDFVACCHNAKIINAKGNLLQEKKLPTLNGDEVYTKTDLKKGAFLLTLSLLFRNLAIFKDFPLPQHRINNGDTYLISLLGKHGKGYYMEDIETAVYRVHSGGIWSTKKHDKAFLAKSRINLYKSLIELHSNDKMLIDYFEKKVTDCFKDLIRNLKQLSFKEVIWVNLNYIKRHGLIKNRYRFKLLIKENLRYLLKQ